MNTFFKSIFAIVAIIFLTGCSLDSLITDSENKSLVILSPNFVETSVQLIIKDPTTNDFLTNDLKIRVISNKKIVDLNGRYKNSFHTSNGILEFAFDPNETISIDDPINLNIQIKTSSKNIIHNNFYSINRKGHYNYLIKSSLVQNNLSSKSNNRYNKDGDIYLTFNTDSTYEPSFLLPFYSFDPEFYKNATEYFTEDFIIMDYDQTINDVSDFKLIDSPYRVKVNFKDQYAISNSKYYLLISYYSKNNIYNSIKINENGKYEGFSAFLDVRSDNVYKEGKFENYNHEISLPENSLIGFFIIDYSYNASNITNCQSGYNLKFNGLNEESPLGLEYKITREDGTIAAIGITSITSSASTHEILDVDIDKIGNTIEFLENDQYYISPNKLDLGGAENCGNTFNFTLTPKENNHKYTLNFQTQCEGESIAYAGSLSAFYREVGSSGNWNSIRFQNGSTTLYLDPSKTYEVKASYNESDINFKFQASEENINSIISQNLSANSDLNDFEYSLNELSGETAINLKLIYKSGSCPMND